MFEGWIAPIIKDILGSYIEEEDLEDEKLSLYLWRGDVVLKNLRIRKDALRSFDLSLDVTEGRVKDFSMLIPWNELKYKPVKISISDISIVCRVSDGIKTEEEAKKELLRKLSSLNTAEILLEKRLAREGIKDEDNSDFKLKLITKIVENVQITIKNIHISYIDKITDENEYIFDIFLGELSAVSTNEEYVPTFLTTVSEYIYKLVKLDQLNVYWGPPNLAEDQSYRRIIGPISGNAKLKTFKSDNPREPVNVVRLEFDNLDISLNNDQYKTFVHHMEAINCFWKQKKYMDIRPPKDLSPKKYPLMWFKYAAQCVLRDVQNKRKPWTIENIMEKRAKLNTYMKVYSKRRQGTASESMIKTLNDLERELPYEDLVTYRSVVISDMQKKGIKRVDKENWSITGSIINWWRAGSVGEEVEEDTMKALYDTVEYDSNAASAAEFTIKSAKTIFELNLNRALFELLTPFSCPISYRKPVIALSLNDLQTKITLNKSDASGEIVLKYVKLTNNFTMDTLFPELIELVNPDYQSEDLSFFTANFKIYYGDSDESTYLSIRTLPLKIVFDSEAILQVSDFFSMEYLNIEDLKVAAQETMKGIKDTTASSVMDLIKSHKIIDLNLDFHAPVILIPENVKNPDSGLIKVDLGRFMLKNARSIQETSNYKLKILYDEFDCKITSVSVTICTVDEFVVQNTNPNKESPECIIECLEIPFSLNWCIIQDASSMPKVKLKGIIPELKFCISEYHLSLGIPVLNSALKVYETISGEEQPNIPGVDLDKFVSSIQKSAGNATVIGDDIFYETDDIAYNEPQVKEFAGANNLAEIDFNVNKLSAEFKEHGSTGFDQVFTLEIDSVNISLKKTSCDMIMSVNAERFTFLDLNSPENFERMFSGGYAGKGDMARIAYVSATKDSPEFTGINRKLTFSFGSSSLILSEENIRRLKDFFIPLKHLATIEGHKDVSRDKNKNNTDLLSTAINVDIGGISVMLIYNQKQISTFNLNSFSVDAKILSHIELECLLGEINAISGSRPNLSLLDVSGGRAAKIIYTSKPSIPTVSVEVCSFRLYYERYDFELLYNFYQTLSNISLYDTAKSAINTAQKIPVTGKILLRLSVDSPVIYIPDYLDGAVAYLGSIHAKNEILVNSTNLSVDISNIRVTSGISCFNTSAGEGNSLNEETQILSDTGLRFTGVIPEGESIMKMEIDISPVRVKLCSKQVAELANLNTREEKNNDNVAPEGDFNNIKREFDLNINCPEISLLVSEVSRGAPFIDFRLVVIKANVARRSEALGISFSVLSFLVSDRITNCNDIYKEVFIAVEKDVPQLSIKSRNLKEERCIYVDINAPKIIIVPEYINKVKELIAQCIPQSPVKNTGSLPSGYRVSISLNCLSVIFVNDYMDNESDILVFGFEKFHVNNCSDTLFYLGGMSVDVSTISLETKMRLLECETIIALFNDEVDREIILRTSQIATRISHNDVLLALSLSKKFNLSYSSPKTPQTSRKGIYLSTSSIELTFIDDSLNSHVPKLHFILSDVTLNAIIGPYTSLNLGAILTASSFNLANSNWEPVIESCIINSIYGNGSSEDTEQNILVQLLNTDITISYVFVNDIIRIYKRLQERIAPQKFNERSTELKYTFRNYTGYEVMVTTGIEGQDAIILKHKEQKSMSVWRGRITSGALPRNTVLVFFVDVALMATKEIALDSSVRQTICLQPEINGVNRVFVCDVILEGNEKIIRFTSGLRILNQTQSPIIIVSYDDSEEVVDPEGIYNVPISASYAGRFRIRPLSEYQNATMFSHWSELKNNTFDVTCKSLKKDVDDYCYQILSMGTVSLEHPILDVCVSAPFVIENLFPCAIMYETIGKDIEGVEVLSGMRSCVHNIHQGGLVNMRIKIPVAGFPKYSNVFSIKLQETKSKKVLINDYRGMEMYICVSLEGRTIFVYPRYTIVNRTDLDLVYQAYTGKSSLLAGKDIVHNGMVIRFLSPTKFSPSLFKLGIGTKDAKDMDYLSIQTSRGPESVVKIKYSHSVDILLGLKISEEYRVKYTKIIEIFPKIYLRNMTKYNLTVRQAGVRGEVSIVPDKIETLYYFSKSKNMNCVSLLLEDDLHESSDFFEMTNIGPNYVKLPRISRGDEFDVLHLEVSQSQSSLYVNFVRITSGCPFYIHNSLEKDIYIKDENHEIVDCVKSGSVLGILPTFTITKANSVLIYERDKLIGILHLNTIGVQVIQSKADSKSQNIIATAKYIDSFSRKITISLKSFSSRASPASSDKSCSVSLSSNSDYSYFDKRIKIEILGLGISLITKSIEEILYLRSSKVNVIIERKRNEVLYAFEVHTFEINDYTSPSGNKKFISSKSNGKFISGFWKSNRVDLNTPPVVMFKLVIQELEASLDEYVLFCIFQFVDSFMDKDEEGVLGTISKIPEPPEISFLTEKGMFTLSALYIGPLKIHISFTKSRSSNWSEIKSISFTNLIGIVFGNVNDAPLSLVQVALNNISISKSGILDMIYNNYKAQIIKQMYNIIGYADFLGNPIGLFNTISSGVSDLFYEPLYSFQITKPHNLGIAVAKGSASLIKKTVFGVSDSISKISGSLGEALSTMTLDKKYRQERDFYKMRRNISGEQAGVVDGARSLAMSVASGVGGILMDPVQGAIKEGVGGFFTGIGKGIVGAFTKPIVGAIDMATNLGEEIKGIASTSDNVSRNKRFQRFIRGDKVLEPYCPDKAYGNFLLSCVNCTNKDGDVYEMHKAVKIKGLKALFLVTNRNILIVDPSRYAIIEKISLKSLKSAMAYENSLKLISKKAAPPKVFYINTDAKVRDRVNKSNFLKSTSAKIEELINSYESSLKV